jgi:hypothetical protein
MNSTIITFKGQIFLLDRTLRTSEDAHFTTWSQIESDAIKLYPVYFHREDGMGEKMSAYRILVGKPEGKSPLGRPRCK